MSEGRPVLATGPPDEPTLVHAEWAGRGTVSAFAVFPLRVDDRVIGAIAVCIAEGQAATALAALEPAANAIAVGAERKRIQEQLRQAQKMEAIGHLAGGVAHDFNNLLTVIAGYTELIRPHLPAGGPAADLVEEIAQAGTRAAGLTRQLLTFGRRQRGESRVVELNAVVADLERLLCRLVGEDVTLELALDPMAGRVRADPVQLEQVLMNLVVNARDAMPPGGCLTVATAAAEVCAVPARGDGRSGRYCRLSVTDTGIGMDAETQARMFEPFFTTKEPGKGTGLGLATVWGIVRQAGGHIAVESTPGRGSTFHVYLPRTEEPAEAVRPRPGGDGPAHGEHTILIAEDEGGVRALTRQVLSAQGYTVLAAGHGTEALRLADTHPGPIHLLVTDVIMPGMSGRQLADRLTARRPGLRVLYLSGYTADAVSRHGIPVAGSAFLPKPFSPAALTRKVAEVLE